MAKSGKWPLGVLQKVGREALSLAREFKDRVEPRLAAGLLDGLEADLTELDDKRSQASSAVGALKLATSEQNAAVEKATELLAALRGAVVRAGASAEQRTAFGTPKPYKKDKVSSVVAALDTFLAGAAKYTDFTRAAGILPGDLEAVRALRAALVSADQSQEAQKSQRKAPVRERNAVQKRIEAAIDAIINAGGLALVNDPENRARFAQLVPGAKAAAPRKKPE